MEATNVKSKTSHKPSKQKPKSSSNLCSQEIVDKEKALKEELSNLNSQIEQLSKEGVTLDVSEQMEALHRYNDIKDTTLIVLNYLSNTTNETIVELHKKYDLPLE